MSARPEILCSEHDEKIQEIEKSLVELVVQRQGEEYRFQMLTEQIRNMGEKLSMSVDGLKDQVLGLKSEVEKVAKQTNEHHGFLRTLSDERKATEKRIKRFKTLGWGAFMAVLVALAESMGGAIWGGFKKLFHGA